MNKTSQNQGEGRARLERCLGYLEQDPQNQHLLAEASDLALSLNDLTTARDLVVRALNLSPHDPHFKFRLSCVARGERNWAETAKLCEELLGAGNDDPAIHYNLGHAAAMLGRFEDAKTHLLPLADKTDKFPNAPHLLVRTLHYLEELDEARTIGEAHMTLYPDDATMAGMLGTLCTDLEDFNAARQWSELALKGKPDNLDALVTAGTVALGDEDGTRAGVFFEKALAVDPNNGRAWLGQGMASMLGFDLKTACASLERAAQAMPDHLGTWNALAWCELLDNDIAAAEKTFNHAMDIDRNFGETHGGLAVIAALQGRLEDATRQSDIALRLDDKSMAAKFAKSLILQRMGKAQAGQELLRDAFASFQVAGGGNLLEMLGRVARKMPAGKKH